MLISLYDVNLAGPSSFRMTWAVLSEPCSSGRPSQDDQIPQNGGLDDLVMSPWNRSADWWVEEDLNLRPRAYQARALTT
jgi:hypothetical protein